MKRIALLLCLFIGVAFSWETVEHEVIERHGVDVGNLILTVKKCYTDNRKVLRERFENVLEVSESQIGAPIPAEARREYIGGGIGGVNILETMSELCTPDYKFVKFSTELSNIIERLEAGGDDLKQLEFTSALVQVLVYEFGTLSESLDGKF